VAHGKNMNGPAATTINGHCGPSSLRVAHMTTPKTEERPVIGSNNSTHTITCGLASALE
ncbi:hypothetical protein AVEN_113609-1, partial [Araneus ventricosus]